MRILLGFGILVIGIIAITSIMSSAEKKRSEAEFQASLATYQTALHMGTSRTQVEDYLRQNGIPFTNGPQSLSDRVSLGQQPRNLFCQPWNVYADFQFEGSATGGADPNYQRLKSIDLHREGVCF